MFNLKRDSLKYGALIMVPMLVIVASGCSDDDDDDQPALTTLSLHASDATVPSLSRVLVCIDKVSLKGNSEYEFLVGAEGEGIITANSLCKDDAGEVIANTFGLDLLEYPGHHSVEIFSGVIIAPGDYTRLDLSLYDGASFAINTEDSLKVPVTTPSANGLMLSGFTATQGGMDITIEFDLRKSMVFAGNPGGPYDEYKIKPKGIRLIDNGSSGHIGGMISATSLQEICPTPNENGDFEGSVYLYAGEGLLAENLEDYHNKETEGKSLPYASTTFAIEPNAEGNHTYEIGFVDVGTYTLAISCRLDDDPEVHDEFEFINLMPAEVIAEQTVTVNF